MAQSLRQINKLSLLRNSKAIGKGPLQVKASTLVETLVASVIIVVIFSIASLTLNNIFKNSIQSNAQDINTHLNKLIYLYQHDKIEPYYKEDFKHWEISVLQRKEDKIDFVVFEARNQQTKKSIIKKLIHETIK